MDELPEVTALAPWFGAARMVAENVGEELAGCNWVCVPFAGGMAELAHIKARTIVASDKHRMVINLARVTSTPFGRRELFRRVSRLPFHPDILKRSQDYCRSHEAVGECDIRAAVAYFVCCWMGRSGKAGTKGEFSGKLPIRWNANGGDSNTRYRSAARSLVQWYRIMRRCNFTTDDVFDVLAKVDDKKGHGIYVDPPFPELGDGYTHGFSIEQHRKLAKTLAGFTHTRVVCRFYDHPLIREIYPESPGIDLDGTWTWRMIEAAGSLRTRPPPKCCCSTARAGWPCRWPCDATPRLLHDSVKPACSVSFAGGRIAALTPAVR